MNYGLYYRKSVSLNLEIYLHDVVSVYSSVDNIPSKFISQSWSFSTWKPDENNLQVFRNGLRVNNGLWHTEIVKKEKKMCIKNKYGCHDL